LQHLPDSGALDAVPATVKKTLTPRFAFVANNTDDTVSSYRIDKATGALTPLETISSFAPLSNPIDLAVHPNGRFLFVANFFASTVSAFAIDPGTGLATQVAGSPFAGTGNPWAIAIDPTGAFLYTANINGDSISAYTIDADTGVLTPLGASPYDIGIDSEPNSLLVHPDGKLLYATRQDGTISVFAIDPATGALAETANSPFPAGTKPQGLAVVPVACGEQLYAPESFDNYVLAFHRNVISGDLAPLGTPTFLSGTNPGAIAADPTGKFLYVASGDSKIYAYAIGGDGRLTETLNSPFPGSSQLLSIAMDPRGRFVYVANQGGGVSAFTRDEATGDLTEVTGSPFATGGTPFSVVILSYLQ
jgi:6-phosphogluconolactonase (cycloisomerase 2 family)